MLQICGTRWMATVTPRARMAARSIQRQRPPPPPPRLAGVVMVDGRLWRGNVVVPVRSSSSLSTKRTVCVTISNNTSHIPSRCETNHNVQWISDCVITRHHGGIYYFSNSATEKETPKSATSTESIADQETTSAGNRSSSSSTSSDNNPRFESCIAIPSTKSWRECSFKTRWDKSSAT
jgi:hypothetical protein